MTPDQLADIEEIKKLKARYFRLMDTKRWKEWANVFTDDARLQWGPNPSDAAEGDTSASARTPNLTTPAPAPLATPMPAPAEKPSAGGIPRRVRPPKK